jgi:hypothetical protein
MLDECGIGDRKRPIRNTCTSTSEEDILSQSPQGFFLGGYHGKVKS